MERLKSILEDPFMRQVVASIGFGIGLVATITAAASMPAGPFRDVQWFCAGSLFISSLFFAGINPLLIRRYRRAMEDRAEAERQMEAGLRATFSRVMTEMGASELPAQDPERSKLN